MSIMKKSARLMSRREVLDHVGVSYPTIWRWMQEGSFPRARAIGGKIAWIEAEVENWINRRPLKPLKGDDVEASTSTRGSHLKDRWKKVAEVAS
jgi:prophage regulatory protein